MSGWPLSGPPACDIPGEYLRFGHALPRSASALAGGAPLTIVALGSSSTAGAWASSPARAYPPRLQQQLGRALRGAALMVLNRGENGEDAAENLARFEVAVTAERPDLVIWQVGTNWLLQDRPLAEFERLVRDGLHRIRTLGADAVLMDTQYSPELLAKSGLDTMLDLLKRLAAEFGINLFPRFAIMRHAHVVSGVPVSRLLAADQLHMNDWSYHWLAKLLATGLVGAWRNGHSPSASV